MEEKERPQKLSKEISKIIDLVAVLIFFFCAVWWSRKFIFVHPRLRGGTHEMFISQFFIVKTIQK